MSSSSNFLVSASFLMIAAAFAINSKASLALPEWRRTDAFLRIPNFLAKSSRIVSLDYFLSLILSLSNLAKLFLANLAAIASLVSYASFL